MYVELTLESMGREPYAGDEPPVPGAKISVRADTVTTAYRNCWCIEVEDLAELRRLVGKTPMEVRDPVHSGTDALVHVDDRPTRTHAPGRARV